MQKKFLYFPPGASAFDFLQALERALGPDPWYPEEECGRIGVLVTLQHNGRKVRFSTGDDGEAGFKIW